MGGVEASGNSVDEAVEHALGELGLGRDEVEVEVLEESEGEARVRVTPVGEAADGGQESATAPEDGAGDGAEAVEGEDGDLDEAEIAARMLDELLALMKVEADVSIRDAETPGDGLGMANAVLDVEGDDLGILIGRRGDTLAALQYVLNLMVAQKLGRQEFFTVDVEGYRRRRENSLTSLARRTADQVKRTGRPVELEPMPAHERRIIHLVLSENRSVSTESVGEGEERRVEILPTRQRQ